MDAVVVCEQEKDVLSLLKVFYWALFIGADVTLFGLMIVFDWIFTVHESINLKIGGVVSGDEFSRDLLDKFTQITILLWMPHPVNVLECIRMDILAIVLGSYLQEDGEEPPDSLIMWLRFLFHFGVAFDVFGLFIEGFAYLLKQSSQQVLLQGFAIGGEFVSSPNHCE